MPQSARTLSARTQSSGTQSTRALSRRRASTGLGWRLAIFGVAMAAAACVGAPRGGAAPVRAPTTTPDRPAPPVVVPPAVPPPMAGLGPEVLLPDPAAVDAEVARVGDLVLRQSHAYARLLSAHPKLALDAVDLLVFDVLVARHAQQHGIVVDGARVERLAASEEQQVREQVHNELGKDVDLGQYVWRLFGMREGDWRAVLRLRTAQRLYQGYVLRFLALREDRVQVRFVVHKDEKVVAEVASKVIQGADFGTLALRHSEDPSRRDGGLLPPFGRGFQHPVAAHAFALQKGEVSAPFRARWGDEDRWFVVYCIERLPGREVAFESVRAEIDQDLEARAISPLETTAYLLRWRGELDRNAAGVVTPDR